MVILKHFRSLLKRITFLFKKKLVPAAMLLAALLGWYNGQAQAKVVIRGRVYDRSVRYGIPGVSVQGTSGAGTATDSTGSYSILLFPADSISFSYLGKATPKFPVKTISPDQPFDISLQLPSEMLPAVTVRKKSYQEDSLENRELYRKVFDYDPGYITGPGSGLGVGVSLTALLSAKKIRRMEMLKSRLEQQEKDKYIDYRFSKALVSRITGLQSPAIDTFMVQYRPSYELLQTFETQYEYYEHIKRMAGFFLTGWNLMNKDSIKIRDYIHP